MRIPKAPAVALLAFAAPAMAIEEPEYQVLRKRGTVEVREYAPYVVAEVLIDAEPSVAGNAAFPILAGYIFGKNKGQKKFAMTAPVTQSTQPMKMAMTAPVTQRATEGGQAVQFVLPRDVTLDGAPEPLDARVTLREVPARRVAVIRFSGRWTDANYNQHLAELQQALHSANESWSGEPVYARYDAPFVPWFMRRNEIWLNVER
jgi:SOUL heme-binding protein